MTVNGGQKEDVYATLLLTETYLPGAMVLAHSLIDAGTTKKLAVLVVDGISEAAITELKTVYSYVIPVPKIVNSQPANLALMNRADLHSAFTKINLWKLTQFRKIVYVDADIVAYVAPDELFDLAAPFSAAPDIGWPDLFNTGLMALTPNEGDYNALLALAQAGVSFDGADQGLINTYYGNNYNRLSFTYNVTPSAHYQYIPAYRHFQADIKLVHFIGSEKPWFVGRGGYSTNSPFTEMTSRWWATYDRHYKVSGNDGGSKSSNLVRSLTKGEFRYTTSWDAQRQSPPTGSNPEAPNFPTQVYAMSSNAAPFVTGYSSAPPLRQIFPWEANQPKATRVFYGEGPEVTHQPVTKKTPDVPSQEVLEEQPSGESFMTDSSTVGHNSDPSSPMTPLHIEHSGSGTWTSYARGNAWDEVPEIERYVNSIKVHQKSRSIKPSDAPILSAPGQGLYDATQQRRGSKVTDFPSEAERPSLPVTPAPIHRSNPWSDDDQSMSQVLPSAAGVPARDDWDPEVQLQKLAKQQSEDLLQKLGGGNRDLPPRGLPHGSEELVSPTYVARSSRVLSPTPVKGGANPSPVPHLMADLETSRTSPLDTPRPVMARPPMSSGRRK